MRSAPTRSLARDVDCDVGQRRQSADEVGRLFGDHYDRCVRVAAWDCGHDRCVRDPEALDATNPELGVDHGALAHVPTGWKIMRECWRTNSSAIDRVERGQIDAGDRVEDEPRQVPFGQPLAHIGRHQERLLAITRDRGERVARHGASSAAPCVTEQKPRSVAAPRRSDSVVIWVDRERQPLRGARLVERAMR
jgi:hypothetical protein